MSAYFAEMEAERCPECGAGIVADTPEGATCANGHIAATEIEQLDTMTDAEAVAYWNILQFDAHAVD